VKLRSLTALLVCLLLALCSGCDLLVPSLPEASSVTRDDFLGEWVNTDPNTGGCTRFEIYADEQSQLIFQGYGACHPTDCVWDPVPMTLFCDSVTDTDEKYAMWVRGESFAGKTGLLEFSGSDLQLTLFTAFTDGSGRSNYRSIDLFRRAQ